MAVAKRRNWVILAYRLPREPSTPRISVWRKLKTLGVAQLLDGLAALPLTPRSREQLEWLADEVLEAGGESSIWIAQAAAGPWAASVGRCTGSASGITSRLPRERRRSKPSSAWPRSRRGGREVGH